MSTLTDFGAQTEFGMHHFFVEIPAAPRDAVCIYEDYGFDGDEAHRETVERRLVLARELWTKIRDDARRDFNVRLKAKKHSAGTWTTGKVKLDRFLGRELCVLGWAAEHASPEECAVICQKWLALRPEERWWLYSKTAAEAGHDSQSQSGWRKALYCALSDGSKIKVAKKRNPVISNKKQEHQATLPIFEFIEKGDI